MLYSAHSILVVDTSPFGRSLNLLPAMKVLREAYPNAFIAAAASSGICELLLSAGLVTEIMDLGVIKPGDGLTGFKRIVRLIGRARRFNFDLILDFAPRPETQFLSRVVLRARTITAARLPLVLEFLLGASRQGYERPGEYEGVLRKLGLEPGNGRIAAAPASEENARFEALLARNGFRGGEPVVVLYTAGGPGAWPIASFAETAHRLANNFTARILAVDEPSDRSFTTALEGLLPRAAIKLTEPRALELMAAVARASVLITDELNLAAAASEMGTPIINLTRPFEGAKGRAAPAAKPASATTDEVFDQACEILQESRSSSLFQH
jgi:ADP-heptose:LPS heptosyltransferase